MFENNSLNQNPLDEHLDANLIAAWADRTLSEVERSQAFVHLAGCEICRERLALTLPGRDAENISSVPAHPWNWIGLAAALAVAIISVWQFRELPTAFRRDPSALLSNRKNSDRSAPAVPEVSVTHSAARLSGAIAPKRRHRNVLVRQETKENLLVANAVSRIYTFDREADHFQPFDDELRFRVIASIALNARLTPPLVESPGQNQILVKTTLGERYITLEGLLVHRRDP